MVKSVRRTEQMGQRESERAGQEEAMHADSVEQLEEVDDAAHAVGQQRVGPTLDGQQKGDEATNLRWGGGRFKNFEFCLLNA